MLMAFNQEGNSLDVSVLLMVEKWLLMFPEGVCVSRSVL